jgi:hypothetical protein
MDVFYNNVSFFEDENWPELEIRPQISAVLAALYFLHHMANA